MKNITKIKLKINIIVSTSKATVLIGKVVRIVEKRIVMIVEFHIQMKNYQSFMIRRKKQIAI